ncbi:MAG: LLM class flavin-dependent oxidoreductase [Bacteroidota bacterium]
MSIKLKLGILDQSLLRRGGTALQAITETVDLVSRAEAWGYSRFWVSEHHNSASIAGSAPEVLMVKLAGVTKKIRIGSGGVMLPNHSALKVAENFRMLEILFPKRIDLGMGRAPGGDRISARLLNPSNDFSESAYISQLDYLQAFLTDTAGTQFGRILAVPQAGTIPEQWILSSSGGSSQIAAQFGLGLAVAKFINGNAGPEVAHVYRRLFKPTEINPVPRVMVSVMVLCADTEEKAGELRRATDYRILQFEQGNFEAPGPSSELLDYKFSPDEMARVRNNAGRIVSGTPGSVKEQLLRLAHDFETDEVMITCMAYSFEDRLRCFELVAEAFELQP